MKYFKRFGIFFLVLMIGGFIAVKAFSDPLPLGKPGPEAESLAKDVLDAVGHDRLDSTGWVSWTFPGGHSYIWHVPSNKAQISYGDTEVVMRLDTQKGTASKGGVSLDGPDLEDALAKAWSIWCNDSWWLIAPHKVMDNGTRRSVVDVSADYPGHRGLLVQYDSGGVTPGDAYLWIVDQDGLPIGYRMWVKILPVKGLYSSWEQYDTLHSGAMVSTYHDLGILQTSLAPVRSGPSYSDIGLERRPF